MRRVLSRALDLLVPDRDAFWDAIRHAGACGMYVVPWHPSMRPPDTPVALPDRLLDGPPPNHPERLATHIQPSPDEARLWAQLLKEVR